MNKRVLIVVGILAVCGIGLIGSVVYPFSNDSLDDSFVTGDVREVTGEASAYTLTATLISETNEDEGWASLDESYSAAVAENGEAYEKFENAEESWKSEKYQSSDGDQFRLLESVNGEQIDEALAEIEEDENRELLYQDRDNGTTTLVSVERDVEGPVLEDLISQRSDMYINYFRFTQYERVEETNGTPVYEPQDGWYEEGITTFRVTDSEGEVRLDADTNEVQSGEVSMMFNTPAGSYLQYHLAKISGVGTSALIEITYDFTEEDVVIEEPDWVAKADDE